MTDISIFPDKAIIPNNELLVSKTGKSHMQ